MKKRMIFKALFFTLLGGVSLGVVSCGNKGKSNSDLPNLPSFENQIIKRLVIDQLPDKVDYEEGDAFSSTGLKVSISDFKNGEKLNSTETTDFTLSVNEGEKLAIGSHEIMVISNLDNVKSTSFDVHFNIKKINRNFKDTIHELISTNNYTVNNLIGQDNEVKGLVTEKALIWSSSDSEYFTDSYFGRVGYGEYENATYRFRLDKKHEQVEEARFISDLGGFADDQGLFSENTYDNLGDKRISNYNIKGITDADLRFIDSAKPEEDNPNRYEIPIQNSKWLFNTIGHIQLTRSPEKLLNYGINSGRIFVELIEDGLKVILTPPNVFEGVDGCVATITNIGTTTIPQLDEFLKNPDFGVSTHDKNLSLVQKLIRQDNYTIENSDSSVKYVVNKNYIYSENTYTSKSFGNFIRVEAGNTMQLIPGMYQFELGETIVVEEGALSVNYDKVGYLRNISLFDNIGKKFEKTTGTNSYKALIDSDDRSSMLMELLRAFIPTIDRNFTNVVMNLTLEDENLTAVEFVINKQTTKVGSIKLTNFGTSKDAKLDKVIEDTLYIK